jgi:hypothetical protein
MYRSLVQNIYSIIDSELPEIKHRALYNDQFNKLDEGGIDEFPKPCIFVSFPDPVEFMDQGAGVQRTGELRVRLYIGYNVFNTKGEDLGVFDLKQKIFTIFNGVKIDGYERFIRRSEQTDEDRTNYYVFIQDYSINVIDSDAYILNKRIEVLISDLEVDSDLIINPLTIDGIRTAEKII